jgi:hypothetical protein
LTVTTFAPTVTTTTQFLSPTQVDLTVTTFAPTFTIDVTPAQVDLTVTTFAPSITIDVTPAQVDLTVTTFAPTVTTGAVDITPAQVDLTVTTFAPTISLTVTPAQVDLTVTTYDPTLTTTADMTPAQVDLTVTTFAPVVSGGTIDISVGYDTVKFFRLGSTRLSLAMGLGRNGASTYNRGESWAPASGAFALPLGRPPDPSNEATAQVRTAWNANKTDTDAVLLAAINAALTAAGYTRPNGSVIT